MFNIFVTLSGQSLQPPAVLMPFIDTCMYIVPCCPIENLDLNYSCPHILDYMKYIFINFLCSHIFVLFVYLFLKFKLSSVLPHSSKFGQLFGVIVYVTCVDKLLIRFCIYCRCLVRNFT